MSVREHCHTRGDGCGENPAPPVTPYATTSDRGVLGAQVAAGHNVTRHLRAIVSLALLSGAAGR
ncbi:hypothetical protein JCM9803A_63910 [Rhodococcus erythropolis]